MDLKEDRSFNFRCYNSYLSQNSAHGFLNVKARHRLGVGG